MNLIPVTDITADLPRHSDPKRVYSRRKRDPDLIVVHTTDTETSIEKLARYDISPGNHIDKLGCPAYTYHATVMRDGSVFKTLDYDEVAWHAGPWNGKSIGVAMMYKCTDKSGRDIYKPVRVLYDATVKFCASRCLEWGLGPDRVQGHRELLGTGFTMFKGSRVLRKTCLLPGTRVLTTNGYKNIEDIEIGDHVIGPTSGLPRRVLDRFGTKVNEDILSFEFKYDNFWPIALTGDHKIWSWKAPKCDAEGRAKKTYCNGYDCGTKKYLRRGFECAGNALHTISDIESEISWNEAKDLAVGDYAAIPLGESDNITLSSEFGKDMAYLVGWCLAEGFEYQNHSARLTLNAEKEQEVANNLIQIAARYGFPARKHDVKSCVAVTINNFFWRDVVEKFFSGKSALTKQLTPEFMSSPVEFQEPLFNGYLNGDGTEDERRYRISTSSEALAHQTFILALRLGYSPSKILGRGQREHIIERRTVNANQEFSIEFQKSKSPTSNLIRLSKHCLIPIDNIVTKQYNGFVYDLTIEDEPQFFANSIAVHNCPGLLVDLDDMRKLIAVEMQTFLAGQGFYTGPVDGQFGPVSRAAMDTYRRSL